MAFHFQEMVSVGKFFMQQILLTMFCLEFTSQLDKLFDAYAFSTSNASLGKH